MEDLERLRRITGITADQIPDADMLAIIAEHPGQIWCAAAAAAEILATRHAGGSGVTAVEDIAIDRRRPLTAWLDLADRWRRRCEDESDEGPYVIEFQPCGPRGVEAVESPWMI
ncbi:hypothetical protein [Brachybacterium hainanense]|uniref:DUF222 domain-containing protein n=1 Tax=Brachybacterium hainanense TaxID=1541174 RepID=A0ABV6R994_9MICO